jgi:hypothetical protein
LATALAVAMAGSRSATAQDTKEVKEAPQVKEGTKVTTEAVTQPKQEAPAPKNLDAAKKDEPAKKDDATKKEPDKNAPPPAPVEVPPPTIPKEVQDKLDKARQAVAEAIVAAQDAGLVDTSIDPPPILDILIKGYAFDAKILRNPSAKKTFWAVTPEVFCGWFTGYNKTLEGVNINAMNDLRIVNPSGGLKAWYDQRANMLNRYIDEIRKAKGPAPAAKAADAKKDEPNKPAEPKKDEPKKQ